MTLEGSLEAFSLPDIFQLLSFTKKTGALRLTGPQLKGVVFFAAGSVTGAASDVSRYALGRRLVGAGLLTDEQLANALDAVRNDPTVGIGQAARDAEALDEGVLHDLVVEQATDAVFDLLRWARGDFAFVSDEANPDDLGVALNVEEIITEGRRRLDEWETLTKTVPSPDAVVCVALTPPEAQTALTSEEWALLALADGTRTVSDLVRLTGRGEFATVRTLAALVERKLATIRRADADADADPNDSLAALVRRQAEVSRLEGRPEPVAPPRAVELAPEPESDPEPAPAPRAVDEHAPENVPTVVPQRPEPVLARRPDFPEERIATVPGARRPVALTHETEGSAAVATETVPSLIERDPSVNKSLLLRLIAGVRGL